MSEEKHLTIYEKLALVQAEINVPKTQYNRYAKYYYRNCEDILNGVKKIIKKLDIKCEILLKTDLEQIGDGIYVKATACFYDYENDKDISITAYAREGTNNNMMDSPQKTGSAISYARKYALSGLLLLDDEKDSDFTNKQGKDKKEIEKVKLNENPLPHDLTADEQKKLMSIFFENGLSTDDIQQIYKKYDAKDIKGLTNIDANKIVKELKERAKK